MDTDTIHKIQEYLTSEGPQTASEIGYVLGLHPDQVNAAIDSGPFRRENGLVRCGEARFR